MDSENWRPNAGDLAPAVSTSDKVLHLGLMISCIYSRELDWEACELALDAVTLHSTDRFCDSDLREEAPQAFKAVSTNLKSL